MAPESPPSANGAALRAEQEHLEGRIDALSEKVDQGFTALTGTMSGLQASVTAISIQLATHIAGLSRDFMPRNESEAAKREHEGRIRALEDARLEMNATLKATRGVGRLLAALFAALGALAGVIGAGIAVWKATGH